MTNIKSIAYYRNKKRKEKQIYPTKEGNSNTRDLYIALQDLKKRADELEEQVIYLENRIDTLEEHLIRALQNLTSY